MKKQNEKFLKILIPSYPIKHLVRESNKLDDVMQCFFKIILSFLIIFSYTTSLQLATKFQVLRNVNTQKET